MKRCILLICCSIFAWNCSSRCTVTPETSNMRGTILTYNQFSDKIAGEKISLITQTGEKLLLRGIRVAQDSTLLIRELDGLERTIPTHDILVIESTNRAIGAVDGLFVGIYSCGVIGYAYSSQTFTSNDLGGLGVAGSTLNSVAIGGLAGVLLGIGYGHKTTYEIDPRPTGRRQGPTSTMGSNLAP